MKDQSYRMTLLVCCIDLESNTVAIVSDISEMYLHIELKEGDRSFPRFLWNSSGVIQKSMNSINASPFVAQFVTRNNSELNREVYPLAVDSTYMDDTYIHVYGLGTE